MEFPLIKVVAFALFVGVLLWLVAMVFMGDYVGDWGRLLLPLCLPAILLKWFREKKIYGALFILMGGVAIAFLTTLISYVVNNLDSG